MLEEKETEILDDLFVKLEGVIVTHKVPSSPTSKGSRSPTKSKPNNDIANNGAVITCGEDSSTTTSPAAGEGQTHIPTSASSQGDTGSSAAEEAAAQRRDSAPSSPSKCAMENHHHNNATIPTTTAITNTSVPDQQQWRDGDGYSTPQGGTTPLSSSPSKYQPCDVTTRQPQAQPQDPNLMPSILSS